MISKEIKLLILLFVAGIILPSCKAKGCSKKRAAKSDTENYYSPKTSVKKAKKNGAKCTKW